MRPGTRTLTLRTPRAATATPLSTTGLPDLLQKPEFRVFEQRFHTYRYNFKNDFFFSWDDIVELPINITNCFAIKQNPG